MQSTTPTKKDKIKPTPKFSEDEDLVEGAAAEDWRHSEITIAPKDIKELWVDLERDRCVGAPRIFV